MLRHKLWTKDYKHEYSFEFKGKKYLVHSAVRLTDKGRKYLKSQTHDVLLTEVFYYIDERKCWSYEFRTMDMGYITRASTDIPPDELIEEIINPASDGYMFRQVCGAPSTNFTSGTKHTKKDWEIPEVVTGWVILFLVFFASMIFRDLYMRTLINIIAFCWFVVYRQQYIEANTTYTYNEDTKHLQKKYEILYGVKNNKENDK